MQWETGYRNPMIFSHYSKTPVGPIRAHGQSEDASCGKPDGLWVSVDGDDDWPSWCAREDYDGLGPYHYRVHLDLEHILVLTTHQAVLDFDTQYQLRGGGILTLFIDWPTVSDQYDGLIIAPYQWDARLNLLWYYGWDCASGCIWDPSAVKHIERVKGS